MKTVGVTALRVQLSCLPLMYKWINKSQAALVKAAEIASYWHLVQIPMCPKPGDVFNMLSKDVKEQLQELTSDDAKDLGFRIY